jgi:hypothetical protein
MRLQAFIARVEPMWPYYFMFFLPAWAALAPLRLRAADSRRMFFIVAVFFTVMVGLRHQVGGDWFVYTEHFEDVTSFSFADVFIYYSDLGYYLFNWVMARLGGGIYGVNLICGAFLLAGVTLFAISERMPWLVLVAAVPYLIIVVGMGYTRQSAAIGLVMMALVFLRNGKLLGFFLFVFLAATFHKTAVVMLPLAALARGRHRWITLTSAAIAFTFAAGVFILDYYESLLVNYVYSDYASANEGAGVRVAMNWIAASFLLLFRRKLLMDEGERRIWVPISLVALFSPLFLQISATATDRLSLYMIPLQLLVAARIYRLARSVQSRTLFILGVVTYFGLVQWVWLNFATHAFAWEPYQMMPIF